MKSSDWNHNICNECWNKLHPGVQPHRVKLRKGIALLCCWCGFPTQSGIYVREDPAVMRNCQHTVEVIIPQHDQPK
jgi:hypothetical protein